MCSPVNRVCTGIRETDNAKKTTVNTTTVFRVEPSNGGHCHESGISRLRTRLKNPVLILSWNTATTPQQAMNGGTKNIIDTGRRTNSEISLLSTYQRLEVLRMR